MVGHMHIGQHDHGLRSLHQLINQRMNQRLKGTRQIRGIDRTGGLERLPHHFPKLGSHGLGRFPPQLIADDALDHNIFCERVLNINVIHTILLKANKQPLGELDILAEQDLSGFTEDRFAELRSRLT
ncbi:hypothetical protein D3C75_1104310 [compost metagenome]